jgi:hypothetical protein
MKTIFKYKLAGLVSQTIEMPVVPKFWIFRYKMGYLVSGLYVILTIP